MPISTYVILLDKVLTKSEILVQPTGRVVCYPEKLKKHIEEAWEVTKNHGPIFSGPMCRLSDFKLINGKLKLTLDNTNYKEFIGTRINEVFQEYGPRYIANPLAICSVITTTDKKILISRRRGVESRPGFYHVIGGYLDTYKHCNSLGLPDPFKAITFEIFEETGIDECNIKNIVCLGLVYDTVLFHPELIFNTEVNLSFLEITKRHPIEKETDRMEFIFDNPQAITKFVTLYQEEIAPTGLANIVLYFKYKYKKVIKKLPYAYELKPQKYVMDPIGARKGLSLTKESMK